MKLPDFLKQFGITKPVDARLIGRSYYRDAAEHLLAFKPLASGECIAHQRGEKLIPSTTFLQWIASNAAHRVTVNDEGAWLFICKRDLMAQHVTKHTKPPIGTIVVVLNKHNECLGYGKLVGPFTSKQVILRREFDIGDLLRREKPSQ